MPLAISLLAVAIESVEPRTSPTMVRSDCCMCAIDCITSATSSRPATGTLCDRSPPATACVAATTPRSGTVIERAISQAISAPSSRPQAASAAEQQLGVADARAHRRRALLDALQLVLVEGLDRGDVVVRRRHQPALRGAADGRDSRRP